MRYRRLPTTVEATQWFPGSVVPGVDFERGPTGGRPGDDLWAEPKFYVTTIHGQRAYLAPGDWVITERDGIHHYPCKPDVFAATYEAEPV